MKLNRRQFLKLTGAALTASVLPLSALAALTTPEIPHAYLSYAGLKPGKYTLSFFCKTNEHDSWTRYERVVEITEEMTLKIMLPAPECSLGAVQLYEINPGKGLVACKSLMPFTNAKGEQPAMHIGNATVMHCNDMTTGDW